MISFPFQKKKSVSWKPWAGCFVPMWLSDKRLWSRIFKFLVIARIAENWPWLERPLGATVKVFCGWKHKVESVIVDFSWPESVLSACLWAVWSWVAFSWSFDMISLVTDTPNLERVRWDRPPKMGKIQHKSSELKPIFQQRGLGWMVRVPTEKLLQSQSEAVFREFCLSCGNGTEGNHRSSDPQPLSKSSVISKT